ncbi:MAG TPA: 3D domain-containing protein [Candidatus Pacearchaeota archaeon]|nr:3D domain-containing protein [Candidatus Pacearchaeota archaeon]HOK94189.1 3D domain-containing protein [Candidatus Pacearchaeota archaeon]HPO75171.1 3D domain-containing protein [Candidatus Pacearchaeota archaeon]
MNELLPNKVFSIILIFSLGINFSYPQLVESEAKINYKESDLGMITNNLLKDENCLLIDNNTFTTLNLPLSFNDKDFLEATQVQVPLRRENVMLTAYSSTYFECDGNPFRTASGTYVREGIVATNFLPFGTKIRIPEIFGDKIFVVEDRMAKRYWKTVDIWMPTHQSALNFGVKHAEIEIINNF